MRLINNLNLSLTAKLVVTTIAVVALMVSILLWRDAELTHTELLLKKQDEILDISSLIASAVASALHRGDIQDVSRIINQTVSMGKISFAAVKSLDNQTMAQAGISKQVAPTSLDLLSYIKSKAHSYLYSFVVPIEANNTKIGTLVLQFKIDDVDRLSADAKQHRYTDALIMGAASIFLLYSLLSILMRNLKNLTNTMTQYINQPHTNGPNTYSGDEIGKLSKTFEYLVNTLHKKEGSLKESEVLLQAIMDNSPAVIFAKDRKGRYLLANKQFAKFFNSTTENLIGKTAFELFPYEIAAQLHANDQQIFESKSIQQLEEVVTFENELKTYISTKFCLFDKNNEVYAICGISTDISERIQNERRLKESEENLRSLTENAIDGILVNKKGKHVFTNPHMANMLNTTIEEIIGTAQDFVLHPSEMENVVQRFQRRLKGQNEPIQYETLFVDKKSGEPVPVELTAFISQWDGEPAGVVFVRDIKERKQTEAELKSYRERLEQMVSERTAALESAIKELETFSYSVSHDLRAPLRSIDGFSQMLLSDYQNKLDEDGVDYLHRVRNSTQRMAQLIDDILLLSRVSRHDLSISQVNLSDIAEESVAALNELYPGRNINTKIAPNMIVNADRSLLRIAMDNLLGNAWKYTSQNERAEVECGSKMENGACVYYVKDNGIGFDMQHVDKLFGAFQRLHKVEDFPGTGIGLATVKRIIDRHNGIVRAESQLEKGATFYFTLP